MRVPCSPHLDEFKQRHVNSWYAASTDAGYRYPLLEQESLDTEVCVIGGGFTGLSCALELAERGTSVVLLEGGLIGFGASGRNGGQVLHGFACTNQQIEQQLGRDSARLCWQLSGQAVERLAFRVAQYNIDCDLRWGYLTTASTQRQMNALREQEQTLQRYDYHQSQLLTKRNLAEQIDSPAYIGALHDGGCGHLHPLRYAQGLAQAAYRAGVKIHEESRASKITQSNDLITVQTESGGQIRAQRLVLACNVDIGALDRSLAQRFLPVMSHIIATEPLTNELASRLLPGNAAVCDSNHVLNYFRLSNDHRMLFGGRLKHPKASDEHIRQERQAELARIFPPLANSRIDYSWGGYIDMGLNKTPQFGQSHPRIYYAQGFAGHGVALTGLAGQLIAQAIHQENTGFNLFARLKSRTIALQRYSAAPLVRLGVMYYRMLDRLGL